MSVDTLEKGNINGHTFAHNYGKVDNRNGENDSDDGRYVDNNDNDNNNN